jgi:hypothetical protein
MNNQLIERDLNVVPVKNQLYLPIKGTDSRKLQVAFDKHCNG